MASQFLLTDNLALAEEMYAQFLADPGSVDGSWRDWFADMQPPVGGGQRAPQLVPDSLYRPARLVYGGVSQSGQGGAPAGAQPSKEASGGHGEVQEALSQQERVDQLIRAFRCRGHRLANLDPLAQVKRHEPELSLSHHGLGDADLDTVFSARSFSAKPLSLRAIVDHLKRTYCGSIGVQYMHIDDGEVRAWLQSTMEQSENQAKLDRAHQVRILEKLTDAETFEQFLHKKFLGARRFSLEGAESLIPLLDTAIEEAAKHGSREVIIGMAHRGRINVLANIIGKSANKIFQEFQDSDPYLKPGRGDVKYHLGYSGDRTTASGQKVHMSLCFNPSHLGFVTPVAQGRVRAKQDRFNDTERKQVLAIAIHGDAAFSGQGTTQEVLNMSQLPGYQVGGTLHILVNNQVGFTTPPELGRSTPYATDVARMLEVPIFHVNGEDPNSVTQVVRLALAFRQRFARDVVVDMYCYRKLGHNESDEPAFTQPMMVQKINAQRSVREHYTQNLIALGEVDQNTADDILQKSNALLDDELNKLQRGERAQSHEDQGVWASHVAVQKAGPVSEADTAIDEARACALLTEASTVKEGFTPHPKLVKLLEQRCEMARGERPVDWGGGEILAYASLLSEGSHVRLSGQDSGRGTFSHRHAVLHDHVNGELYTPLAHLRAALGNIEIWDSPLSESGVLGFDYGYSLDRPDALVAWEAQFGDFANGAQVIIDQFLASGEAKWQRYSGLTLLLPHGYEGAGSEHSSARLERFLQLAAENNLQVVNPTTPSQMFHVLRRQVRRQGRWPLVVATPKSLLRHPMATSPLSAFANGTFVELLDEPEASQKKNAKRVLLCSGKVYYDLCAARAEAKRDDLPILRLEQLYPRAEQNIAAALKAYPRVTRMTYVQEEPLNMGAWPFLRVLLGHTVGGKVALDVVGREAAAAPACGSASRHKLEQQALMKAALEGPR